MSLIESLIITLMLILTEILYFRIAKYYNIIDKPNERSSHSELVIRGGGIIYLVAAVAAVFLHPEFWMPVTALFIIGVISFADDRMTLSNKIRILFHLIAVNLMFYYLNIYTIIPWWGVGVLCVLVIGIINAYNFMDGINGINGAYSLVILAGLQYVNSYIDPFIIPDMIWLPIIASVVFLFFNFRKKAKCFAGDVGSVTIALWIIFLLLKLMLQGNNYAYILFLAVYGVDSILTIMHRLILKQNIFEAHRLHFYQILANERRIPHLVVSTAYAIIQFLIICIVIFIPLSILSLLILTVLPLALIYVFVKPKLMLKSTI